MEHHGPRLRLASTWRGLPWLRTYLRDLRLIAAASGIGPGASALGPVPGELTAEVRGRAAVAEPDGEPTAVDLVGLIEGVAIGGVVARANIRARLTVIGSNVSDDLVGRGASPAQPVAAPARTRTARMRRARRLVMAPWCINLADALGDRRERCRSTFVCPWRYLTAHERLVGAESATGFACGGNATPRKLASSAVGCPCWQPTVLPGLLAERILDPDAAERAAGLHVLGQDAVGAEALGGHDDQGIPEREGVPLLEL